MFKFNEAISLQVTVRSQAEIDYYWDKLSQGGDPRRTRAAGSKTSTGCRGRLFRPFYRTCRRPDPPKSARAMMAMLQMKKLDLAALKKAHAGDRPDPPSQELTAG